MNSPLIYGGTGSHSEEPGQPDIWPEGMESGTLNTPGIAGLLKSAQALKAVGVKKIGEHERILGQMLADALGKINGVRVFSGKGERLGVVSFMIEGVDAHETAMILDQHYDIAVRSGVHCAPLSHQYLDTSKSGLVRASAGLYNTKNDIQTLSRAVEEIKEGLLG
ncbi:aminotransferase class V-fold PLP-dependent enzyme [Alteribacter keqinensis]|uniref:aminotransferase class V-fold PLP-dependent enzyme n=1 Tax=Alteribacter keqinensis TaxID=2483800 RepID=UPI002016DE00|nr:aminotransferase class V-fold PLP-dependent enzyme [Alteribacter keqinensis]